ncbi:hypothetical protein Ahu01nite_065720 [Winogradskya humida]|uniref:Uncharacterized protein n=1 Tax=Winogradskya humida TaxID=113566 RepID=A0ABQ3ZY21_9ACTN|nr:hypothetical protein Ahu01nite_065720 [Actinoplanes humidus]
MRGVRELAHHDGSHGEPVVAVEQPDDLARLLREPHLYVPAEPVPDILEQRPLQVRVVLSLRPAGPAP